MPTRIAILAFDGISAFHLSVPFTVFGEDRSDIGIPRYEVSVCVHIPRDRGHHSTLMAGSIPP